jgi:hypothetical protein
MKLLQKLDGSLYIAIHPSRGEERCLTGKPSEATILHCGARMAVSVPSCEKTHTALQLVLLQDCARKSCHNVNVPCCITVRSSAVYLLLVSRHTAKLLGCIAVSGLATSLQ